MDTKNTPPGTRHQREQKDVFIKIKGTNPYAPHGGFWLSAEAAADPEPPESSYSFNVRTRHRKNFDMHAAEKSASRAKHIVFFFRMANILCCLSIAGVFAAWLLEMTKSEPNAFATSQNGRTVHLLTYPSADAALKVGSMKENLPRHMKEIGEQHKQ